MSQIPAYYNNVNQTLLEAMPKNAKRILEIGCGAGALGKAYISTVNPSCEYWGVEYVPEMAAVSETILYRTIVGSIEDNSVYSKIPENYFDILIFGDVLEHLREPWDVLKLLTKNMKDDGQCISCIPNVQHWSILRNLLDGNWRYQDSGLMDRTHLRFFTRTTMIEMFNNNGWKVTAETPRIFANPQAQKAVKELLLARKSLGLTDAIDEREFRALQWVLTARKETLSPLPESRPKALLKINFCTFAERFMDVRTRLPSRDLGAMEDVEVISSLREIRVGDLKGFDGPRIIVAQRPKVENYDKWLSVIAALRRNDCVFVYEIDDHPSLLKTTGGESVDRSTLAKTFMAVQTSTERLADYFRPHNENVVVFRNSCHGLPAFVKENETPVLFYGALNRNEYSAQIAKLLNPILEKYGAEFHVVMDRDFYNALSISRKTYHHALDYDAYLNRMRKCDILISPLQGLPGEEYKSDIKYVEASAQGLATVASELVYGETIRDGENGLIARDLSEWPAKVESLLKSRDYRRSVAYNAWDYVRRERLFAQQAPLRVQWYLDLWGRREELWNDILKRVPELHDYK